MIQLSNGCGFCHKARWCQSPFCIGAKSMTPQERVRAGLPPLALAKPAPVISRPDSVISQASPVISRVISRVISQDEGRSEYDRVRDWRARHPETHKARHAAYMRQWRAQKKSPAG